MKAKLTFDLDEPDERIYHETACKSTEIVDAIGDYSKYLRDKIKYETLSGDSTAAYQDARDKLWEYLDEYKHLING